MVAEAEQLEADAVIGVDVDYESIQIGQGGGMLMVSASRTAVKFLRAHRRRNARAPNLLQPG
jgi:uncharacterized protein YbjQ (UPF0145 family)